MKIFRFIAFSFFIVLISGVSLLLLPSKTFASSLFLDQFNGSGELSTYNSDYVNFCNRFGSGSNCGEMDVVTDHLETSGHDAGYLYTGINQADMCASVDFNWHNSGGGWASVIVRGDNSSGHEDEFQARSDGSWNYLQDEGSTKFDSGPLTIDSTISHTLKVCASGTTVTGYVDGVLYATEQDTTNTSGNAGFGLQLPSSDIHTMDNFTITTVNNALGNNNIGGSFDTGDSHYMNGSKYTTGSVGGTAQSISTYVGNIDNTNHRSYQLAIYTDNSGVPGTLVANTTTGTLTANAWNTLPITAVLNANTTYWLMYNTNGRTAQPTLNNMAYDPGSTGMAAYASHAFGSWPTTYPTATLDTLNFSMYATYQ